MSKPTLVSVRIETHLGAVYWMPDMDADELKKVLPETGRSPEDQPTLQLINASFSILSVVFRVIKTISIEWEGQRETLWQAPESLV